MIPAERGETFGSWSYAPWDARKPGSDARQCLDRGTSQAGECVPFERFSLGVPQKARSTAPLGRHRRGDQWPSPSWCDERGADRDAYDVLVTESVDAMYRVARLVLRDYDRASDAVQEALDRCWRDCRSSEIRTGSMPG
jgi:hypothetical protein